MKRIILIGCPGSGKSTMALKIHEITGLPAVHLDRLWWLPGWQETTKEDFDQKLLQELEKPEWIIDGNFSRTLPKRLEYSDTVVFLDYPRRVCLWGVVKRVMRSYGKSRPDMGEGCPERFDLSFLRYIWHFRKKNEQRYLEMLKELNGQEVVILRSRREGERWLSQLKNPVRRNES